MTAPQSFRVTRLEGGAIADDGGSLDIDIRGEAGEHLVLTVSFDQFTWLLQSLLELSNALYERQIAHGQLRDVPHAPTMLAEGFQLTLEPKTATMLVQIAGRRSESAPLGLGAFRVEKADLLRALGEQCLSAADELEQRRRPT